MEYRPLPKIVAQASCAPAAGYALNREQREILDHTRHRAAGGHYCGGGKEMDALVQMGLMESHGSFLGNPYFGITAEGVKALRAHTRRSSATTEGVSKVPGAPSPDRCSIDGDMSKCPIVTIGDLWRCWTCGLKGTGVLALEREGRANGPRSPVDRSEL